MKKEHSIAWKLLILLFEVVIGGSILGAILNGFLGGTGNAVNFGTLSFWIFLVAFLVSFSLLTYIGIVHITRKSTILPNDPKILAGTLGLVIIGIGYINTESILISVVLGVLIGTMAFFLLNRKVKQIPTLNQQIPPRQNTNM